ncbi:hypothetical protein Tco_0216360, partial [Tanacetum coccineum]
MVLYFVPDVHAPHWDDVIVISSDEEYSSEMRKRSTIETTTPL